MLALERHRQLLRLLQDNGSLRTADVARRLGVTEETVRRDFEKLEAEGALLRSHGGAVSIETQRREFSSDERSRQNAPEKIRIARVALDFVQPGQTIFFDASTTVRQLAVLLPDQPLTILTNSLQVALTMLDRPSIHVVILGGAFLPASLSCVGWQAERTIERYRIDAAFLSCRGLDWDRGASDATESQALLKCHIMERADTAYLLADSSKLGVASSYFFAGVSRLHAWITDATPAVHETSILESQGLKIIVAP